MYSSSANANLKRTRWKKSANGLTHQSTSSSTTVTNDEPIVSTVAKVSAVGLLNAVGDDSNETGHSHKGTFFEDGLRKVDFVLVFEENLQHGLGEDGLERHIRRQFFEENLGKAGLELEEDAHRRQATSSGPAKMTVFMKVHAPWSVLCRQAEALKMRMPLQLQDHFAGRLPNNGTTLATFRRIINKIGRSISQHCRCFQFSNSQPPPVSTQVSTDKTIPPKHPNPRRPSIWSVPFGFKKSPPTGQHVTWPFQRNRIHKYLLNDVDTFFSPTQRIEIVWEILQRSRNDPNDEKKRGIESLLGFGIYTAAFPLHDGSDHQAHTHKGGRYSEEPSCDREKLRKTWASWRCAFQEQPIDLIRRYFGEKVAFYFSFLGFYTNMLVIPSIFGMAVMLYGLVYSDDDEVIESICDGQSDPGNRIMCPVCKLPNCDFSHLSQGCWSAIWEYRVDNEGKIAMACFTVIWATVFLKMWKRREAELAFDWDTYDVELEDLVARPEYEEMATSHRANPITREIEPYVPTSTRVYRLVLSSCVTALMLVGVGVALFALIFSRIALYGAYHRAGIGNYVEASRWTVHALTFVVVTLFEQFYTSIAAKITSWECPRTQSKWLSSYLWKVFAFQLFNDFVPIGYAAWIKGKTATAATLSWSSELCEVGGCMSEATEIIAVLLMTRMVIGNAIEIGIPFGKHLWSTFQDEKAHRNENSQNFDSDAQWHQDMLLETLDHDGVAKEYLEMIIQFAFCTLFVPAFPAAPLVCLLNNIVEIRVDAINFVTAHRRPLPIRVPGIEIWNSFLDIIAKLAVLCNAGLIGFTSEIVPRLYYKYRLSTDGTLKGYDSSTLSFAPKEAWAPEERKYFEHRNLTGCWYEDSLNDTIRIQSEFNNEEEAEEQIWWEVMTMRIVVFAIFATTSFTFQWLFNFVIPDTPGHVITKIQRRRYVVMKAMETELVYDRWLKSAVAAAMVKRQAAESVLDAFTALAAQQKVGNANATGQSNGVNTVESDDDGEHLEPMSSENLKHFVHKRR